MPCIGHDFTVQSRNEAYKTVQTLTQIVAQLHPLLITPLSLHGGQVHHTDTAVGHQMTVGSLLLPS